MRSPTVVVIVGLLSSAKITWAEALLAENPKLSKGTSTNDAFEEGPVGNT